MRIQGVENVERYGQTGRYAFAPRTALYYPLVVPASEVHREDLCVLKRGPRTEALRQEMSVLYEGERLQRDEVLACAIFPTLRDHCRGA